MLSLVVVVLVVLWAILAHTPEAVVVEQVV
jgi:hypothetical protein